MREHIEFQRVYNLFERAVLHQYDHYSLYCYIDVEIGVTECGGKHCTKSYGSSGEKVGTAE